MSDVDSSVFPPATEAAAQAIRERLAAKGLIMEPENEGEDLTYLGRLFDMTCERLDRESAQASA